MSSISGGSVRNNASMGSFQTWSIASKQSSRKSDPGSASSRSSNKSNSNNNNNTATSKRRKTVNIARLLEGLKLNGISKTKEQIRRAALTQQRQKAKKLKKRIEAAAKRKDTHRRGLLKGLHPSEEMKELGLKKKKYKRDKEFKKIRVQKGKQLFKYVRRVK